MKSLLLLLALLALSAAVFAQQDDSYCGDITPEVSRCTNPAPRDLLFLVDGSNSMDPKRFYGDMLDYTLALYCAFNPDADNTAGMVVFGGDVKVYIPQDVYTRDEWYDRVRSVADTENTAEEACCTCCTPHAEAFIMANTILQASPNEVKIAFVITDGVPSNNEPGSKGGDPRWAYYDNTIGFNPAEYNAVIVAQEAAKLKQTARLMIVGVPNIKGVAPEVAFFSGTGPYNSNNVKITVNRNGKAWTAQFRKPPNPIVSLPILKNVFSSTTWVVGNLVNQTVDSLCEITQMPTLSPTRRPTKQPTRTSSPTKRPTPRPTTQMPTRLPTLSPTRFYYDQVDVTFVIDRSTSMIWQNDFCLQQLATLPAVFPPDGQPSSSACWELFMRYVLKQSDEIAALDSAGPSNNRVLGWANEFSEKGKGLRVQLLGFACENKQRTPKMFDFSDAFNNYEAITSRAKLLELLNIIRTTVTPFGGTCPGLSIEQSVKYVERSPFELYPFQTVILVTDGVFYDMPFPTKATLGLQAYRVMRFSVGIAVAKGSNTFGMTKKEIATQATQLAAFASGPDHFMNLGALGWQTLLQGVSSEIALAIETDGRDLLKNPPIARYTWCGWRRILNCKMDNWRQNSCKWPQKSKKQWACKKKK